jgi:hypothetical protein
MIAVRTLRLTLLEMQAVMVAQSGFYGFLPQVVLAAQHNFPKLFQPTGNSACLRKVIFGFEVTKENFPAKVFRSESRSIFSKTLYFC